MKVADLNLNGVGGEGELSLRGFFLRFVEEEGMVGIWAQHRTLRAADPFFDPRLICNRLSKLNGDCLLRLSGPRRRKIQEDRAFPRPAGLGHSTVHGSPKQKTSAVEIHGALEQKNVPGACIQGSREFYPGDRLYDGGFSYALVPKDTDCGYIDVSADAGVPSDNPLIPPVSLTL